MKLGVTKLGRFFIFLLIPVLFSCQRSIEEEGFDGEQFELIEAADGTMYSATCLQEYGFGQMDQCAFDPSVTPGSRGFHNSRWWDNGLYNRYYNQYSQYYNTYSFYPYLYSLFNYRSNTFNYSPNAFCGNFFGSNWWWWNSGNIYGSHRNNNNNRNCYSYLGYNGGGSDYYPVSTRCDYCFYHSDPMQCRMDRGCNTTQSTSVEFTEE